MLINWLTLSYLSLSTAQADAITLGIRGANAASEPLAERLDANLALAMASREQLQAMRVDPSVCGPMALVDCLLDQGLDEGVELALGGEVISGEPPRILFSVVDVGAEDLIFTIEMVPVAGGPEGFGKDILQLLIGVVTEDIAPLEDLRAAMGEEGETEAWDAVESALQNRIPERWELHLKQLLVPIMMEKIAVADEDRSKLPPWQRLGMEPDEYGLFQASEMSIEEWRDEYGDGSWSSQVQGRRGQIIIRPVLGAGKLSHGTLYEGWYLLDETDDLAWLASAAWHGRSSGPGADVSVWLGYGLSPVLELDVGVGFAPTTYTTHVQLEIADDDFDPHHEESAIIDLAIGLRLLAAPRPMLTTRPVFGGGLRYLVGPETGAKNLPPESAFLPAFAGSKLGIIEVIGGVERTLRSGLDLTAWVPVGFGLLGRSGEIHSAGDVGNRETDWGTSPMLSVGVELGLGIRRGGD